MSILGYARVSTDDQSLDSQHDALNKYGVDKIFNDVASGSKAKRIGLDELLMYSRPGDIIVVSRLDRLGRSLKHLIAIVEQFKADDIGLISLSESIDTTTSVGKLIFHIFGAIAEFEKNLIKERTLAGLAASRARGNKGGRHRKFTDIQIKAIRELYASKTHSVREIGEIYEVSRATIYFYINKESVNPS